MMRMRKKEYVFLTVLTLFVCWFFVGRHGMFASDGDWMSQHSVIFDYFRQQFYHTGQLFPEFAAGLGGGQNIYSFSYYGLYSPVLLPSYFLPFVKMGNYLMAVSVLCLVASVLLLYAWLKTHGFSPAVCLTAAVLFLLASPMVYQSYRQVMFVNYMPFLCMAFMGVDRYWKEHKTGLYTAGVFLMILTSFYFSIAGIFALLLYGGLQYRKVSWKYALPKLFLPVITAVLASGVLLIPTAYALFARGGSKKAQLLPKLFLFDFSSGRFAYSGYGIGLTAGILTVLFCGLMYRKWQERLLSAGCLLVLTLPFFSWILNGGLYVREKALIPFLPLLCFLTALCLEKQRRREISFRIALAGYLATVLWYGIAFLVHGTATESGYLVLGELALAFMFFLPYFKWRCWLLPALPSLLCLVLFDAGLNGRGAGTLSEDFYEKATNPSVGSEISAVLEQEQGLYRIEQEGDCEEKLANINRTWNVGQWITSMYSSAYQKEYKDFREKIFQAEQPFRNSMMQAALENPLFGKLMGVKYTVGRKEDTGRLSVDTKAYVAPVIYATNQVISMEQYQTLDFPYNQTILMKRSVVENSMDEAQSGGKASQTLSNAQETDVFFPECEGIFRETDGWSVQAKKDLRTQMILPEQNADAAKERLFYIQFDVKNHQKSQDVAISIAGIRNKLSAEDHIYYNENTTFTYVVKLDKNQDEIEIVFGKGNYTISGIKSFVSDCSILTDMSLYQSEFQPDSSLTKGNRISGKITVKNPGWLITSIPYDRGFRILIDCREVTCQKVNSAFLGAAIEKGEHQVEIVYHAPGMAAGKLFSCMGLCFWALTGILERRYRRGNFSNITKL